MDAAGYVSEEEIQVIWGKILAGEFNSPGATPPNMRRILSEFTPPLAEAFRVICGMQIDILPLRNDGSIEMCGRSIYVPYDGDKMTEIGVSYKTLNELETLGVLRVNSISHYINKVLTNDKILIGYGDKIDVIEKYNKGNFPFGNVMLTSAGEVLKNIVEPIKVDDYYNMVKANMKKKESCSLKIMIM